MGEGDKRSVTGSDTKVGRVREGDKRSMLLGVIPRLVEWERGTRGVWYWE